MRQESISKAAFERLAKSIDRHGLVELSKALGVRPQALYNWRMRRQIPAGRVLKLEEATGIPRHLWRPDIYPREAA